MTGSSNGLAFTRALKVAAVYPALKAYGLTAPPGGKPSPRLILLTGTVQEVEKLPEAFYTREGNLTRETAVWEGSASNFEL